VEGLIRNGEKLMSGQSDNSGKSACNIIKATLKNVSDIYGLLIPYVSAGQLLPRKKTDITKDIDFFLIADYHGLFCGCVSIKNYSGGLFEVRSLVVHKNFSNLGIGTSLVAAAVKLALASRAKRVFALTRRPNVFLNAGFERARRELFPEKIWSDCLKCPKHDCCDEVALQMVINE
jgi:amino-acid N-acetyltransferase